LTRTGAAEVNVAKTQGFFARAGTPQDIIEKLNAALVADLK
jgi:tripartite-type tricarboxylate transporter receptor subunit TctC